MARQNPNDEKIIAELTALGAEITALGYHAVLASPERRPRLRVRNPQTLAAASVIAAEADWYWWREGRRLAVTSDPARAARLITHGLHVTCHCHE